MEPARGGAGARLHADARVRRAKRRWITALALVILPLAPGAADAEAITLTAPYAGAATARTTHDDGTILTLTEAAGAASAADGTMSASAFASSSDPIVGAAVTPPAAAVVDATFRMQPTHTSTGGIRVDATLTGSAATRSRATAGIADSELAVTITIARCPFDDQVRGCWETGNGGWVVGHAAALPGEDAPDGFDRETFERTGIFTFTDADGACVPATFEVLVLVTVRGEARALSDASASAALSLDGVRYEEFTCA